MSTSMAVFNEAWYLDQNPDVKLAVLGGIFSSGAQHFYAYGGYFPEFRAPNAVFDAEFYLTQNSDVRDAINSGLYQGNAFHHFVNHGLAESRMPSSYYADNFDEDAYLAANSDVADNVGPGKAFASAFQHFALHGYAEDRPGTPEPQPDPTEEGQTFTLTTGIDNLMGTAGNDTFIGNVETIANGGTFNNGDLINGGAGTDTFNISVVATGSWPAGASVSNVEIFNLRNVHDNTALTFAGITGAEQVWSDRSTSDTVVNNLQNNVALGIRGSTKHFSATFADDKVGSSSATLNVAVDGAGTKIGTKSDLTVTTGGSDKFTKLAVHSSGADSFVNLKAGNGTSVALTEATVTGNAGLVLIGTNDAVLTGLTKLDASGMTAGGVNVDMSGNDTSTTGFTFTGSAGNDTVKFAHANLNAAMSLVGNAGRDTLEITPLATNSGLITSAIAAKVSGFEVLRAGGQTLNNNQTLAIDASLITGLEEVQIQAITQADGGHTGNVNVSNLGNNAHVTFLGTQGATGTITNVLTFTPAVTGGATRNLKVELGDGAGVDGTKNGVTLDALNVATTTDLTLHSVGGDNVVTAITTTALKNLYVTGDKKITLSPALIGADLVKIDA